MAKINIPRLIDPVELNVDSVKLRRSCRQNLIRRDQGRHYGGLERHEDRRIVIEGSP